MSHVQQGEHENFLLNVEEWTIDHLHEPIQLLSIEFRLHNINVLIF